MLVQGVTVQPTEHLSSVGSPPAEVRVSVTALPSSQASPTSTVPLPQYAALSGTPATVVATAQALVFTAGQVTRPVGTGGVPVVSATHTPVE